MVIILYRKHDDKGIPGGSVLKNLPAMQKIISSIGHAGYIPRTGRFPGEGNGDPLQCSYLGNPMNRGALLAIVHGVTKNQIRLSD